MRLRRIKPGCYETLDGAHRIIQMDWDGVGPRGGDRKTWEHGTPYRDSWDLDGFLGHTLREARIELERKLQQ